MVRILSFVLFTLSLAATEHRAHAASFALTRLTDNTWDEMAVMVDRLLVIDQAMCPNAVFTGRTAGGNPVVHHAWKTDDWVVQPIVEDPAGLRWPSLARAPGGAVHAAYCRSSEAGTVIEHTRIVGGSPDPPEPIGPADYSIDYPSIAVGADGTVHVVFCWAESICYVRREPGGWTPPEWLAEGRMASLAVGPDGECHIVYDWADPQSTSTVWYLHGGPGAWSAPEQLAGTTGQGARLPTVAVDDQGNVHTAYEQRLPDDYVIAYRVRMAGSWSEPEQVAPGAMPAIALDSGGHPCVAFWAGWPLSGVAASVRGVPVSNPILTSWVTLQVDPEARFGFELPLRPGLAWDVGAVIHVVYESRDPRGGDDVEMWHAAGSVAAGVGPMSGTEAPGLSSWPNPARRSIALRWTLGVPGWARVAVSDVRGRHVRTLREGAFATGEHVLTWDGLDAHGRPVPPGVYWCRVSTGQGERARKVVLTGE